MCGCPHPPPTPSGPDSSTGTFDSDRCVPDDARAVLAVPGIDRADLGGRIADAEARVSPDDLHEPRAGRHDALTSGRGLVEHSGSDIEAGIEEVHRRLAGTRRTRWIVSPTARCVRPGAQGSDRATSRRCRQCTAELPEGRFGRAGAHGPGPRGTGYC
ncbi:hypothetical protein ABZ499_29840 [Streptomyces sp. NPDC019990]|uniref:hypothetical protein n=1 Tax=Streptomyces sp. NPDC019990 TaxID=3154693 RepID=UPI003411386C